MLGLLGRGTPYRVLCPLGAERIMRHPNGASENEHDRAGDS